MSSRAAGPHSFTLDGGRRCEHCHGGTRAVGPICPAQHVCEAGDPWPFDDEPNLRTRVLHPDAVVTREPDDQAFSPGNKTRYQCPHCEMEFEKTEADS